MDAPPSIEEKLRTLAAHELRALLRKLGYKNVRRKSASQLRALLLHDFDHSKVLEVLGSLTWWQKHREPILAWGIPGSLLSIVLAGVDMDRKSPATTISASAMSEAIYKVGQDLASSEDATRLAAIDRLEELAGGQSGTDQALQMLSRHARLSLDESFREDRQKVLEVLGRVGTKVGAGLSLAGANLRGLTLSGNYSSMDFEGADLTRADLTGADLSSANMVNTRLVAARFSSGNPIVDAPTNNHYAALDNVQLIGADLRCAEMAWVDLSGVRVNALTRFSGANLCGANFTGQHLDGIDFTNCLFNYATLREASLKNCTLRNASFLGSFLPNATLLGDAHSLEGCNFAFADLSGATLSNCVLDAAALRDARITISTTPPEDPPPAWWASLLEASRRPQEIGL